MKYSLHIGLNSVSPAHYNNWDGRLVACEADAKALMEVCKDFEWKELLLTDKATFETVRAEISVIAAYAQKGDLVIITLSGHGGQVRDAGTDESEGMDETLCLYDGMITDDAMRKLLSGFRRGVRIVTIFDTCYSGSNSKRMPARRGKDDSPLPLTKAAPRQVAAEATVFDDGWPLRIDAHHLHLGACLDTQEAYDGAENGVFTGALLRVLSDLKAEQAGVSWDNLMKRARRYTKGYQSPKGPVQYGRRLNYFKNQPAFQ
jgi:hypothetical protein